MNYNDNECLHFSYLTLLWFLYLSVCLPNTLCTVCRGFCKSRGRTIALPPSYSILYTYRKNRVYLAGFSPWLQMLCNHDSELQHRWNCLQGFWVKLQRGKIDCAMERKRGEVKTGEMRMHYTELNNRREVWELMEIGGPTESTCWDVFCSNSVVAALSYL